MVQPPGVSRYNLDQWDGFTAILRALEKMDRTEIEFLRELSQPYLRFREALEAFQRLYLEPLCVRTCYETGVSACCGFESIFTFFADQVVTLLFSREEEIATLLDVLQKPNKTRRCVYLGSRGCLWKIRPISCTMFFCDEVKNTLIHDSAALQEEWERFQAWEKEFTWPDKEVLFDLLEKHFLHRGVETPFMYFHKSPGLLRVKARAGLGDTKS